jgi:hypothetical protein
VNYVFECFKKLCSARVWTDCQGGWPDLYIYIFGALTLKRKFSGVGHKTPKSKQTHFSLVIWYLEQLLQYLLREKKTLYKMVKNRTKWSLDKLEILPKKVVIKIIG